MTSDIVWIKPVEPATVLSVQTLMFVLCFLFVQRHSMTAKNKTTWSCSCAHVCIIQSSDEAFFWLSCVYFLAMLVWGKSKGKFDAKERKDRNVTASLWKCNLEKKTQRREGMGKRWKLYFSHESLLFRNLTLKGVLKWNRPLFLLSPSHLSSYSKKSGLW